ncbi:UDP-N-acetylmuramoyl-L-alanyl-D-glutamate--2,6-diaminopimelate ligase [candidate division WOR-3 bacterium]|nr:UDP-N-acetylmuramoyl-L-alanyl-D-glutamate--2,6-diaminopimelate ligase [candidate division WOR-3 bacterium]
MQLSELVTAIDGESYKMKEIEIKSIEFDSRKVKPGALFIAVKGEEFNGNNFIDNAIKNGAVAVVTQKEKPARLPQIIVQDTRAAMGKLARRFYGDFADVTKIGITGTNGKTTTSFLLHSILENANKKPGLIGTIYYIGKTKVKAERTTPESLDIFKLIDQFRKDGAKAVVMEVSSHALSLKRVDDMRFHIAVFTNLSQDHLDFHRTFENYKAAKMRIFSLLEKDGFAIFNLDDPVSKAIELMDLENRVGYGVENRGDIFAEIIKDSIDGLNVDVIYKEQRYRINSNLIGKFNIYNILAAFATGVAMDINTDIIIRGIEKLKSIRGRMERVVDNIFVDFAHTPSAIEKVLMSLKQYTCGKLIIVFGCGGDRDKEKRPKMGAIASRLADFTIITSDNPRKESPKSIIGDIEKGMNNSYYKVIEDRREAIRYAMSAKKKNDILIVTGKGHEEHQIIGDKRIEFDDAGIIRECFEN